MSIEIAIAGRHGRMGEEIAALLANDSNTKLVGGFSRQPQDENTYSDFSGWKSKVPDVLIDFSSPDLLKEALLWCVSNKCAYVGGTTGFTENQYKELDQAAEKIPVLWAANMSLGITIIQEMIPLLCKLDQAEFQIEETHHKFKKDKPSGTAIELQKRLKTECGIKNLAEPLAIRGGGVFGDHKLMALTQDEMIVIEHRALNRTVFARGAIHAARWIVGQPAGKYTMKNALGLA